MEKELNKNILFVCITVHCWRGLYKISEADIKIGKVELDKEKITDPRWKLMPKYWHDRFTKIEHKIRSTVDKLSLPFPIRGIDIVPRSYALKMFQDIDKICKTEFYPAADEFAAAWPGIVNDLKLSMAPDIFNLVRHHLPDNASTIRQRFHVVKHVIPMTGDMTGFGKVTDEEANEFAVEINKYTQQFISDTTDLIVKNLHDELNNAVDNLVARIDEKGIVKEGTVDMVRRAFDKLKAFDFAASPDILKKMNNIERTINETSVSELNLDNRHGSGLISTNLIKALRSIQKQYNDDVNIVSKFGRKARAISI